MMSTKTPKNIVGVCENPINLVVYESDTTLISPISLDQASVSEVTNEDISGEKVCRPPYTWFKAHTQLLHHMNISSPTLIPENSVPKLL